MVIFTQPILLKGIIMHHRFFPKDNFFEYKSFYISFPIQKIKELKKTFFSINSFNLFSFYSSDYGLNKSQSADYLVKNILSNNSIKNVNQILLITHPRVLGYVFNPVSFWLCLDKSNLLIAVICEVNNTCGQKHYYLCSKNNGMPIKSDEWLEAKKEFYVSPFMEVLGKYKFRFEFTKTKIIFFINYFVDNKLKLSTSLKCQQVELTSKNLLFSFVRMPFFTFKTIFLIHYQALKLLLKSIKYGKCPAKLKNNLTISKNGK